MTFAQITGFICGVGTLLGMTALWDSCFTEEIAKPRPVHIVCLTIFTFIIAVFIATTIYRNLQ